GTVAGTATRTRWSSEMNRLAVVGTAALTLAMASSAIAQSAADREEKRIERVEKDNRDIRRDARDARQDRLDITRDAAKLKQERAERNRDIKLEERAIEHGNLKAAEKYDARRREEQRDINAAKRDIRRDKKDLARDKTDLNRDISKAETRIARPGGWRSSCARGPPRGRACLCSPAEMRRGRRAACP